MDAKYFCESMNSELTGLKARLYSIIREIEQKPEDARGAMRSQLAEMNQMVDELKTKIDDLNTQCPADWSSEKQEIETLKTNLTERINLWDAEHIAGGYVGG